MKIYRLSCPNLCEETVGGDYVYAGTLRAAREKMKIYSEGLADDDKLDPGWQDDWDVKLLDLNTKAEVLREFELATEMTPWQ